MSELQVLYVILAVVYLSDCLVLVRRVGGCFRTDALGRFRYCPGRSFETWGGLTISWPLPPLGRVAICQTWPISISPDAVVADGVVYLRDVDLVAAVGREVRINGAAFVRTASPAIAEDLASMIVRVKDTEQGRRERVIDREIERSLDVEEVRRRVEEFRSASMPVQVLSHALFLYLFLLAPWVVWRFGLIPSWAPYLGGLAFLALGTTLAYALAHRKLHGGWPVAHAIAMTAAPPMAIRSRDALFRDLLAAFQPLAIASVLCRPEESREMARTAVREARHPIPHVGESRPPEAPEAEAWFRARLRREIERRAARVGGSMEELLRPVLASSPEARGYCPRCLGQYVAGVELCPDCGGIPLVKFEG